MQKAIEMERMKLLREYGETGGGVYGSVWMNHGSIQHAQGPISGMQGTWQPNVPPYSGLTIDRPSIAHSRDPRFFQPLPNRAGLDNWRWNVVLERLGILPDEKPAYPIAQDKASRGFVPVEKNLTREAGRANFMSVPSAFGLRQPTHEEYYASLASEDKSRRSQQHQDNIIGSSLLSHDRVGRMFDASANTVLNGSPTKRATAEIPAPCSANDSRLQLEENIRLVAQSPGLRDTIKHLMEALYAKKAN